MRNCARCVTVLCAVVVSCVVLAPVTAAECPDGVAICATVSAWESTEPGYEGYWEYCAEVEWNTTDFGGHGLSHTDLLMGLEDCASVCDEGVFAFTDPAGEGEGEGGCTVYFYTEFKCQGDPHFPQFSFGIIKFEAYQGACEPGPIGTALLCFYSQFQPAEWNEYPDHIGVKFAQNVETGPVFGQLPGCPPTPVEPSTWTLIKGLYR